VVDGGGVVALLWWRAHVCGCVCAGAGGCDAHHNTRRDRLVRAAAMLAGLGPAVCAIVWS
jgi:hypothetical protein